MARKEHEHPLLENTYKDFVLVACLGVLAIAIAILVANPSTLRHVQRADDAFLRFVVRHRTGWMTAIGKVFNVLGSSVVTLPVRILAAAYLAFRRRWWHFAAFASAIALSEIVSNVMKTAYDRPRPPGSLVHTTASSFPSGHAVATSVTAVALVIAFVPTGRQRAIWGTVAAVFSFLMAISRAYLAAHWLSDAIEGTLIGVTCALLPAIVIEAIRERRERRANLAAPVAVEPEASTPG